jgi:hypothetical protein
MKSFRSCLLISLSVVGGLILLVVLLFVGGRVYGQWRMAQVTQELDALARDLGYTPGAHLHHRIAVRDVNIISGSAYCEVKLYYTTSMNAAEFTERLNQLLPETESTGRVEGNNTNLYTLLDLTMNGIETWKWQNLSAREPMSVYHWPLSDRNAELYETMYLSGAVEYKGNRIKGNVVRLFTNGGVFPIWMQCPATFNDTPDVPFD